MRDAVEAEYRTALAAVVMTGAETEAASEYVLRSEAEAALGAALGELEGRFNGQVQELQDELARWSVRYARMVGSSELRRPR